MWNPLLSNPKSNAPHPLNNEIAVGFCRRLCPDELAPFDRDLLVLDRGVEFTVRRPRFIVRHQLVER